MAGGAGAQAALQAGGSIASTAISGVQQARRRRAFGNLEAPELDEWYFQRALMGDPEAVEYVMQNYPELLDYVEDPRVGQAEMMGLEGLVRASQEGYLPEERAAMQAAMMDAGTAMRGQREALGQQYRMRGMGGSGIEAMQQAAGGQAGANRAFQQAAQMGMGNLAARRQALQSLIPAAGQVGGRAFGQAAQKSGVGSDIERFNIANRASTQQQNIANQMQVNLANQQANLALAEAKEREGERKMQLDIAKAGAGAGG